VEIILDSIYVPSEDVVARIIEDELIIVPLVAGVGDADEELYTMNETGRAIWTLLDGKKTLGEIVSILSDEYSAIPEVIEHDVLGIMKELANRRMVVVYS
jgi:Coenzyme PQQ synthesis protein D (PqqD)